MKKRYLLLCTLAALLASCSKSNTDAPDTPDGASSPVRFTTEVGTRGVSTTTANIQQFGVYGYHHRDGAWNDATTLPNLMDNLKVSRVYGTDNWSYGEPIDWNAGDGRRFTFLAYSPYAAGMITADNPTGNGLAIATPVAGIPTLDYETLDDVPGQVDLLTAVPHRSILPQEQVRMRFNHSLVRIGFTAYSAQAYTTVQSITISGMPCKGSMPIDGQHRWTIDPATKDFTIDLQNTPVSSADEQNPTDLSAGTGYFILLPADWSTAASAAKVIFRYTLGGEAKTRDYTFAENWQHGEAYTYKIDLGGSPGEELLIKEVTIEDWNTLTSQTLDPGNPNPLKFSLTYDANGGSAAPTPQTGITGGTYATIPADTPKPDTGYSFDSWNTKADGKGTTYRPGERIRVTADTTLYAIYTIL